MRTKISVPSLALLTLLTAPLGLAAQSVLVEAKTISGDEVATIRTDSMRLLVPLHLLVGGLLFPDGTVQTTAAADATSVTSAQIVDGTIVDADISTSAAIADTKLGTISTAGKVANSATTATAGNTAGAIVARDAAGGFAASFVQVGDSLRVRGEGSFLATGTYNDATTLPPPVSGGGTRMLWYPEKAAFRAGNVYDTQWDAENIGDFSIAAGRNTIASGDYSVALGSNAAAVGDHSTALGESVAASGEFATAFGINTTASGRFSTALGVGTVASGEGSTAFGSGTTADVAASTAGGYNAAASGASTAIGYGATASNYSTALGFYTTATGNYSTAFGYHSHASGSMATALGRNTTASGMYSTALGFYTTAQAYESVVIGRYNVIEGNPDSYLSNDPLFVAGNGMSDASHSNALTLYNNGNLTIAGTLTQSSDARLKEGIEPLEGTLGRVLHLTPIRYHFRAGIGRPGGTHIGLTAQDVQPLFPELVKQDGDGYLSLSYANLSAVLVKAVQEQQDEMEELKAEIRALREARNAAEARVARLERLVQQLLSTRSTPAAATLPGAPR
ncbi:MAG: tail fiber domain-containing protein [Gemmatimonadota bacterium]